jgi:NAD(P)-dependent dehydrogenase (short-subunit alcohol dehydrogenase family)
VALNHFQDDATEGADKIHAASRQNGHSDCPHRTEDADVAVADAVDTMTDRVVAAWGRLGVLVNNAGIQSERLGERTPVGAAAVIAASERLSRSSGNLCTRRSGAEGDRRLSAGKQAREMLAITESHGR